MANTKKKRHINKKHSIIKKLLWTLAVVFALGAIVGLYGYYQAIYRPSVEPATTETTTNTDATLFTDSQQRSVLRSYSELYQLAFTTDSTPKTSNMIDVPGLKSTRTFASNKGGEAVICTSMTPQGMAVVNDYILISAYCHTHQHNSVIYVIDKNTHEYIKEIVLKGKPHVGGLAYDPVHHMIWVSTSHHGMAAASAFTLRNMEAYDMDRMGRPIVYTMDYDLHSIEKDSFMTYDDGYLYIGHFNQKKSSVVQKYAISDNGGLVTQSGAALGVNKEIALPEEIKEIPREIQGMAIYEDKVILTQSYGIFNSKMFVYNYDDVMTRTQRRYTQNLITLPQKLEQIYIDGDDLYLLFESGAYAYRGIPLPRVDKILTLDLSQVLKVDIEDLKSQEGMLEDETQPELVIRELSQMTLFELTAYLEETIVTTPADIIPISEMAAGEIISQARLANENIDSLFYVQEISPEMRASMIGNSYRENDDISLDDLRYVRVLHMGFDGETHIGELVVNRAIATEVAEIFRELYLIHYPIEKLVLIDQYGGNDEESMSANNSSAFNYRTISFSDTLSNHARGFAIDINPLYNPYVKMVNGQLSCEPANAEQYMDRERNFDYKIDETDACYQIFTQHGFTWGGSWNNSKDYQHFEKVVDTPALTGNPTVTEMENTQDTAVPESTEIQEP